MPSKHVQADAVLSALPFVEQIAKNPEMLEFSTSMVEKNKNNI